MGARNENDRVDQAMHGDGALLRWRDRVHLADRCPANSVVSGAEVRSGGRSEGHPLGTSIRASRESATS